MNRGNITPRPDISGGIYGFPQVAIPSAFGSVGQTTPGGLIAVIGVPQSPLFSPSATTQEFTLYPLIGA